MFANSIESVRRSGKLLSQRLVKLLNAFNDLVNDLFRLLFGPRELLRVASEMSQVKLVSVVELEIRGHE